MRDVFVVGQCPGDARLRVDDVKLDAVHQSVIVDGTCVRGASAHRILTRRTGELDVSLRHRVERNHLDRVDLDDRRPDGVPTANLRVEPFPEPESDRDPAGGDGLVRVLRELHRADVMPSFRVPLLPSTTSRV